MLQKAKIRGKNICVEKPIFSLISLFLTLDSYGHFDEFSSEMTFFEISKQSILLIGCSYKKGLYSNNTSDKISCFVKKCGKFKLFLDDKKSGIPPSFR